MRRHNLGSQITPIVSVDRDTSLRRLGRTSYGVGNGLARSQGDVQRGNSVSVGFISAGSTLEFNTSIKPFSNLTASGTRLARMIRVDGDQPDALPCTDLFERRSKLAVGHALRSSVGLSVSLSVSKTVQVLDGDEGVVFLCETDNFVGDLIASRLGKVGLVILEFSELPLRLGGTSIGVGLKFAPSYGNVSLFLPDISSKIELFPNSFLSEDSYGSESSTAYVHPDNRINTIGLLDFSFEGNENSPLISGLLKAEGSKIVSFFEELVESLPSSVLCDGESNPFIEGSYAENGIISFRFRELSTSGNIIGDGVIGETFSAVFGGGESVLAQVHDYLRMEVKIFFDTFVFSILERISRFIVIRNLEENISCLNTSIQQVLEDIFFSTGQFKSVELDGSDFFHAEPHKIYINNYFYGESGGAAESNLRFPSVPKNGASSEVRR